LVELIDPGLAILDFSILDPQFSILNPRLRLEAAPPACYQSRRMKRLRMLSSLAALAALASGCAAVATLPLSSLVGLPSSASLEIHTDTQVRLEEANFVVTKTNVVGQSRGFSLLGIITIFPADFTKAMNRLCAQAQMQTGRPQTLSNLIMERDATYFILFSIPRVRVRADVIEFQPLRPPPEPPRPRIEPHPPPPPEPDL
jgi:hypothetical protein